MDRDLIPNYQSLRLSVNVGIEPVDGSFDFAFVLKRADGVMCSAKELSRDCIVVSENDCNQRVSGPLTQAVLLTS